MNSIQKKEILERLSLVDAKLEVILAELMERNLIDLEDIVICAKGLFHRTHSNDVLNVDFITPKHYKNDLAYLNISREGLYDALPQALFHLKKGRKGFKDVDAMVESSKLENEEEKQSRLFFLPFEQEFFRKRIDIEKEERNLLFGITEKLQPVFFDSSWNLKLRDLDFRTKSVLFFLLPLANHLAGDVRLTTGAISSILGEHVEINTVFEKYDASEAFENIVLGEMRLDVDSVLGNEFDDGIPQWEIKMDSVEINSIPQYLEGGHKQILLELIEEYFIPMEVEIKWNINLKESVNKFTLTENKAHARLGLSTII